MEGTTERMGYKKNYKIDETGSEKTVVLFISCCQEE
jgi:hypothetical protein